MEKGTWTDLGATGVASTNAKPYNAIDPHVIRVDDTYYMTFGSFWKNLYQVPLNGAATKVESGSSSVQVAYTPSGSHAQEAAYVISANGYFYLFFSVGSCCGYDKNRPKSGEEYKIMVCRSRSVSDGYVSCL